MACRGARGRRHGGDRAAASNKGCGGDSTVGERDGRGNGESDGIGLGANYVHVIDVGEDALFVPVWSVFISHRSSLLSFSRVVLSRVVSLSVHLAFLSIL